MEMKDSGERQQFEGGAQRDTAAGKPKMSLLSPHVYMSCVRATAGGTEGIPANETNQLYDFDSRLCLFAVTRDAAHLVQALDMLLSWVGYEPLCNWLEQGSKKYSAFNWAKGMPFSRVLDSLLRHRAKIYDSDEDHPAAMMCNLMFLIHYIGEIEAGRLDPRWNDLFDFKLYKKEEPCKSKS